MKNGLEEAGVILQIRYPPHTLQLAGQILIHTCFELINAAFLQVAIVTNATLSLTQMVVYMFMRLERLSSCCKTRHTLICMLLGHVTVTHTTGHGLET